MVGNIVVFTNCRAYYDVCFHLFLMKKFGKVSFAQRVLTVVLPFVYMAVVNYSKDTEIYKEFLLQGEEEAKKKMVSGVLLCMLLFLQPLFTHL